MYKGYFSYAGFRLNKQELPKFKGTVTDPKCAHAVSKSMKINNGTFRNIFLYKILKQYRAPISHFTKQQIKFVASLTILNEIIKGDKEIEIKDKLRREMNNFSGQLKHEQLKKKLVKYKKI